MRREWVPLYRNICNASRLRSLSDAHRLFYVLVLSQCDAWGRCDADPARLWSECWSTFGHTLAETTDALDALISARLLKRHDRKGLRWIQVPDWEDKAGAVGRIDRRGKSAFPGPGNSPESVRTNSGVTPDSLMSKSTSDQKRAEHTQRGPTDHGVRNQTGEEFRPFGTSLSDYPDLSKPRPGERTERPAP